MISLLCCIQRRLDREAFWPSICDWDRWRCCWGDVATAVCSCMAACTPTPWGRVMSVYLPPCLPLPAFACLCLPLSAFACLCTCVPVYLCTCVSLKHYSLSVNFNVLCGAVSLVCQMGSSSGACWNGKKGGLGATVGEGVTNFS